VKKEEFHIPVLLNEVIQYLQPQPGGVFVDATLGGGGHAKEILSKISPQGKLIGIDQDSEAIKFARKTF
jgi:16S rRNA (cytosine1402-N4)-methyltransferase